MSTTAIKERPILFSGPMVRAILDGRKTQTRRIIKGVDSWPCARGCDGGVSWATPDGRPYPEHGFIKCPYGQPSDRLWVREKHAFVDSIVDNCEREDPTHVAFDADKTIWVYERCPHNSKVVPQLLRGNDEFAGYNPKKFNWRPSIYMPRWACRLVLHVTALRVERLQGIDPLDCVAEGADPEVDHAVPKFMDLWESIHGAGSWEQNPWLWVVEFKRIKP